MRALVLLSIWYACELAAFADAPRHALRLTRAPGAESCIDAGSLAAAVEARLGRTVFTRTEPPAVIIDAQASPGWHVAIAVRGADGTAIGERVLDDPATNCRALDDALVLVIALIIDPEAAMREPSSPQAREPWRVDAGASLLGAAGLLPGAGFGGGVHVGVDPPALPAFEIHGTAWLGDETRDQGRGGRFSLLAAGLAVRVPTWKLETLVGVELARMAGSGIGFDRVQDASAVIPALAVEPRIVLARAQRVSFSAGLVVWIPLLRPRFTFEQAGMDVVVYQPAPLAGIAHVSADLRF
jgi:hypothetical protein